MKNEKELLRMTMDYIKTEISLQTEIDISSLRDIESFENYGMDSVTIMAITESMQQKIGHLSKTLFFEYETIEELAQYLLQVKAEELSKMFGIKTEGKEARQAIIEQDNTRFVLKKNAITKKKQLTTPVTHSYHKEDEDIAIIGISGQYPQAENLEEYWENLKIGRDCVTEIPAERWDHSKYYDPDRSQVGKSYAKWGGFLKDVDKFDPLFFHISPLEADFIDPQERLFLQTSWKAFEDAGYSREAIDNGNIGVFVGVMFGLYQLVENKEYGSGVTGRCNFASIANRVSYFFNIHGPSIALDTMCSSSLTALYIACNSIRNGEIDMAVVGGVNLCLHPNKYIQLSQGNFLSSDGRCRAFGEDGDGYVPGEGVGSMIIKPMSKAIADGDHIYSVIKGIGINAGGKSSGYTVPNRKLQTQLIQEVLRKSKIDPRSISYVEAHGTGTALGDPIEINAITSAYEDYTQDKQFCKIGSVKSNIGHTESAAGMASITKVILQMQKKQLVPSIHSDILNPYIEFEHTPFTVQHGLTTWEKPVVTRDGKNITYPRRAAISAFGAGGANAHLILEEYEEQPRVVQNEKRKRLFVLSAKNQERLEKYAEELLCYLEQYTKKENKEDKAVWNDSRIEYIIKESITKLCSIQGKNIYPELSLYDLGFTDYEVEQFCSLLQEECSTEITRETLMIHSTVESLEAYLKSKLIPVNEFPKEELQISLDDLEYTLLTGRTSMEERLAIVASDLEELMDLLQGYLLNETDGKQIRFGNVNDYEKQFEGIMHSDEIEDYKKQLVADKNLEQIAELWIMGNQFDWEAYFKNQHRRRLSLPTYPFQKVRCWVTPDSEPYLVSSNSEEVKKADIKTTVIRPIQQTMEGNTKAATLEEYTLQYLRDVFSTVLKIPQDVLLPNSDFENYGLDSISVKSMNQYFEGEFGKLPSTLLFTYKNLQTLSNYFVKNHREHLAAMMAGEDISVKRIEQAAEEKQREPVKSETVQMIDEDDADNDVAIIGMSGRMPQSNDLEDFFSKLEQGKDFITDIPKERWDYEKYPEIKCHFGSFLNEIDQFDPQFFNIAPMTAKFMDPQERILIQTVWSCLEDAGYTPEHMENKTDDEDTRGNVAVYVGATFNEYGLYGAEDHARGMNLPLNAQIYSFANRISYLFNFGGPSLTVDTACSSSLYAVHLACDSIIRGECNMAVAGGVNLSLHPTKYITLNWGSFLATDGHCRTFGDGGDGYVPGEGAGAVLLKSLRQAKKDNDHIYAVIKGSAVNHGGKTYGYSVPNPVAQSSVIKKALKKAKVNPRTISYVEAHGTGTALGDPIEITALTEAYRQYTEEKQFCAIGSVKSNIGHLEAAAGISQLIKVILQMRHHKLVPSRLNTGKINENLDFEDTPFYVQLEEQEWKRPIIKEGNEECKRRAGISAFGVGGVNVHMIVEEYEEDEETGTSNALNQEVVVPLSAKSNEILNQYVEKWLTWLEGFDEQDKQTRNLTDASYTLMTGRIELPYRVVFIAKNYQHLEIQMRQYLQKEVNEHIYTGIVYSIKDVKVLDEVLSPDRIASGWVNGEIAFSQLEDSLVGKRISLPTYPFAKETYWLYSRNQDIIPVADTVQGDGRNDTSENQNKETILEKLCEAYESERLDIIVEYIQKMFAELLGFSEGKLPDVQEGYFSMGLESIATRQACNMLEDDFHVELNEQIFFSYPSIVKTAEYLLTLIDFEALEAEQAIGQASQGEKESSVVLCKKILVEEPCNAVENKEKRNAQILCICSLQNQKLLQLDKQLKPEDKLLYVTDYAEALKIIKDGFTPGEIVVLDIDIENNTILSLFALIKEVQKNSKDTCAVQYYYVDKEDYETAERSAVRGFLSTLQMEDARFSCKEIRLDRKMNEQQIVEVVREEYVADSYGNEVVYKPEGRYIRVLAEMEEHVEESGFKQEGVYLITGGLGGVGIIISRYLCTTYHANLVLCGRRELKDAQAEILNELNALGGTVTYLQADITKEMETKDLIRRIKEMFGHINGVIHTAGVVKDALITNKKHEDFQTVLAPKLAGTTNLDSALKEEPIDLFILCSSLAAVMGNVGQSDYCYANSFMDEFARERNRLSHKGVRYGKTVSINWPFWSNGGMKVDEDSKRWMSKKLGLTLMENEVGLHILEISANTDEDEVIAMHGYADKMREVFSLHSIQTVQTEEKEFTDAGNTYEKENERTINELSFEEVVKQLELELL